LIVKIADSTTISVRMFFFMIFLLVN